MFQKAIGTRLTVVKNTVERGAVKKFAEAIAMDQGAKNLPEENQVYYIKGVGDDGGFLPLLRIAYVENGEIVQFGEEK